MPNASQCSDGRHADKLNQEWKLVVDYRATSRGADSLAYKNALMKASAIKNQVMIRSYRKHSYIYWEVWEYR